MDGVRLRTVDAFTEKPFTGNPAAVLVLPEAPTDEWMAAVARETNLSDTGFVIREELPVARRTRPGLVTVLIGANDVVQGSTDPGYQNRLGEIYDALLALDLPVTRVLAISAPDFSALPGAAPFGTARDLRIRIDAFNRISQSEAAARGFHYADISAISREESKGRDWLAADGLHPGPAQHRTIAAQLWTVLRPAIKNR